MWTVAFCGPIVCGGSAPGTPVRTVAGVGFVSDPGAGVAEVSLDDDDDGCVRVMYQALPKATPRTARMMMNGNIRFM